MEGEIKAAFSAELSRIEEDCIHSAKAHFNAGARLGCLHWMLGGSAAVASALAGASLFADFPIISGVLALVAAVLTSLVTFLKPSERAAKHQDAGNQYLAVRGEARRLRLLFLPQWQNADDARDAVESVAERHSDLNRAALPFTRGDFEKARKGIDEDEASYAIDQNAHVDQ
jgi:hypothetical protein